MSACGCLCVCVFMCLCLCTHFIISFLFFPPFHPLSVWSRPRRRRQHTLNLWCGTTNFIFIPNETSSKIPMQWPILLAESHFVKLDCRLRSHGGYMCYVLHCYIAQWKSNLSNSMLYCLMWFCPQCNKRREENEEDGKQEEKGNSKYQNQNSIFSLPLRRYMHSSIWNRRGFSCTEYNFH